MGRGARQSSAASAAVARTASDDIRQALRRGRPAADRPAWDGPTHAERVERLALQYGPEYLKGALANSFQDDQVNVAPYDQEPLYVPAEDVGAALNYLAGYEPYEPGLFVPEEEPEDYTDSPQALANRFGLRRLEDALAEARALQAEYPERFNGDVQLKFDWEATVPAKAVQEAIWFARSREL